MLVSYEQAARHLGVSKSHIRRYIAENMLTPRRLPSPTGAKPLMRLRTEDLDAIAAPVTVASEPGTATPGQLKRLLKKERS